MAPLAPPLATTMLWAPLGNFLRTPLDNIYDFVIKHLSVRIMFRPSLL